MAKKTETDGLIDFVIDRLPEGITYRRQILEALIAAFPECDRPRALLSSLDTHLADQRELVFSSSDDCRGCGRLADQPLQRGTARLGDQPMAKAAKPTQIKSGRRS